MAAIVSTRINRLQAVSPRATSGIDQSGVVVALSNSAVSLPADSLGTVTSYAGATTTISVTHGGVDQSANWTFTKSDGAGVTSSLSGQTLTVSSLVVDLAQVTITASRAGYATQTRTFSLSRAKAGAAGANGTSGANGQRGSVTLYASGSAWSDSTANNAIVTATGSSTRVIGDTVTISSTSFAETRYWGGTSWLSPGVALNGNLLVKGTVSADVLSGGQITGVGIKIAGPGGWLLSVSDGADEIGYRKLNGYNITVGNLAAPGSPCITATTVSGSTAPAIRATSNSGANAIESYGPALVTGNLTVNGSLSAAGGISGLSKSSVGLGNVDNTADANKSVNAAAAWGSVAFQSAGGSNWWTSQNPIGFIRCSLGLIPYYPG